MSQVIALFNQSGGVGKTTLTMNLGFQLAVRGHKVLLVDMDPQASLTVFMGLDVTELDKTIYDALISETDEPIPIIHTLNQMDLSPANILLANAEQELVLADQRELRLKEPLTPLVSDYDFILIDCPPSLGILSQISLIAATHVLVPIQTQFKALMGTDALLKTVKKVQRRLNKSLGIAGFCPTMYSSGNALDQRTLEAITEQLSPIGRVFTPLPRATALAEASEYGKPLASSPKKNSAVLAVFDEIATAMEHLE
ncbi:Chromosome (plasmid) partitioning protein ParA [uncultured Synechococcales cyanobacterium]|uniref:Chromosome (Plasmid) partitioning protein ParA n=1 Tax=uncultured Synechococcales cyanobacterium TaxID=1936017 RepID=A0A6J4VAU4_9CYAN|nr:Chromosome (plasmid) partitioning protein ParA [uncultured Synechococcales cyanobacterium]